MRTFHLLRDPNSFEYSLWVKENDNVQRRANLRELEACKRFLETQELLAHSAAMTFLSERCTDLKLELEETKALLKQKVMQLSAQESLKKHKDEKDSNSLAVDR